MSIKDKTLAALKRLDKRFSNAENWIKGTWYGHGLKPGKSVNDADQPREAFYVDDLKSMIDENGRWLKPGERRFTDGGKRMSLRVREYHLKKAKKCDQFCLEGAMHRVGIKENDPAWKIVEGVTKEQFGRCIVSFNDAEETTFPMVRDVVTRAIETRKDQLAEEYRAKL